MYSCLYILSSINYTFFSSAFWALSPTNSGVRRFRAFNRFFTKFGRNDRDRARVARYSTAVAGIDSTAR